MANIHDVHMRPQPTAGPAPTLSYDPELVERIRNAKMAQSNLSDGSLSSSLSAALRKSETPMPGTQGSGLATTAANPLEVLGVLSQRMQGNKQQREVEALRRQYQQQANQGTEAALDKSVVDEQFKQDKAAHARRVQDDLARQRTYDSKALSQAIKVQEEERNANRPAYKPEAFVDAQGNKVDAYFSKAGQYLDSVTHRPIDVNNYTRQTDLDRAKRLGVDRVAGISPAMKKDVLGSDLLITDLNRLTASMNDLTDKERANIEKTLGTPSLLIQMFTPEGWEEFTKEKMHNLSEREQKVMKTMYNIDSGIKKDRYGSTIPAGEKGMANVWSPGTTGIGFNNMTMRINELGDQAAGQIGRVDALFKSDFNTRSAKFQRALTQEDRKKAAASTAPPTPAPGGTTQVQGRTLEEKAIARKQLEELYGAKFDEEGNLITKGGE